MEIEARFKVGQRVLHVRTSKRYVIEDLERAIGFGPWMYCVGDWWFSEASLAPIPDEEEAHGD